MARLVEHPASEFVASRSRGDDQRRFISAIRRLAPNVVQSLAPVCLALRAATGLNPAKPSQRQRSIAALARQRGSARVRWGLVMRSLYGPNVGLRLPEVDRAAEMLRAWKARWGLEASWIDDVARAATMSGRFTYLAVFKPVVVPEGDFAVPGWNPTAQTESEWVREVNRRMKAHVAERRRWVAEAGLKNETALSDVHLEQTVRFQCLGESYKQIASAAAVRNSKDAAAAVSVAVTRACARLGLRKRSAR